MASTDAFTLKNSDLNAFLYADVGTEMNGSVLTMLSVLARLGQDPCRGHQRGEVFDGPHCRRPPPSIACPGVLAGCRWTTGHSPKQMQPPHG